MFDFPASPAVGDVSNGYMWNGTGWSGGPVVGTPTTQFFPLDNLPLIDIIAPSWAKSCVLTGVTRPVTANAQVYLQYSLDGTNFIQGAATYSMYGPILNAGSTGYQAFGFQDTNGIWLTVQGDNNLIPHIFEATVDLTRPSNSVTFGVKIDSRMVDSAGTSGGRSLPNMGVMKTASGTGLKVQKMRLSMGAGNFGVGSWLRVQWLGSDIPQSNAITEAPSDGCEYVRVNGIWRLKSQTLDFTGQAQIDVVVPTGAKMVRWNGALIQASTAVQYITARVSADGATFLSAASDYSYAGYNHYTGTGGYVNSPAGAQSSILMSLAQNDATVAHVVDGHLALTRPAANTIGFFGQTRNYAYNTASTTLFQANNVHVWVNGSSASLTGITALKALRFMSGSLTAWSGGSMTLDWMY